MGCSATNTGIMFHHFHGDGHPAQQGSLSVDTLRRIIAERRPVSAQAWIDATVAGESVGECLTFDDGLSSQVDVALPVLREHGLTAFWFVNTAPLVGEYAPLEVYRAFRHAFASMDQFYEAFNAAVMASSHAERARNQMCVYPPKYLSQFPFYTEADKRFRFLRDKVLGAAYFEIMAGMMDARGYDAAEASRGLCVDADGLKALAADGHVIGLHSHAHPTDLAGLPMADQRHQYARNAEVLTGVLGRGWEPLCVSHPSNSYHTGTLDLLREMGVQIGFRANTEHLAERSSLEFAREDCANL
jgi:peptidoglycan/xylan/chitin deacetylase (PgdA/CDA1 family)